MALNRLTEWIAYGTAAAGLGAAVVTPRNALAHEIDPRLQAALVDSGDLGSKCEFSDDGHEATCVAAEDQYVRLNYRCAPGSTLNAPALPAGASTVNATLRQVALKAQAAQHTYTLSCDAPAPAAGSTEDPDVPRSVPLHVTVVPATAQLRDGAVAVVRQSASDETDTTVEVAGGLGVLNTVGEGKDGGGAVTVDLSVGQRLRRAFAERASAFRARLRATGVFGGDSKGTVVTLDPQGELVDQHEDGRRVAGVAIGPEARLCTDDEEVCGSLALQAGPDLGGGDARLLGLVSGGVDFGTSIEASGSRARVTVGSVARRAASAVRAFLGVRVFGGKTGDTPIVGAGVILGVEK